jgi:hypothetical protein
MKVGGLICVLIACVLMLPGSASHAAVERGAFEAAQRVGEGNERSFFLFTTSIGHYVIRHDGFGEVSISARRRVFQLTLGGKARLEKIYFHEYQGDVVLVYSVSSGAAFISRMNQQSRKRRWLTSIEQKDVASCVVEGDEARCGAADELTKINLNTGLPAN